MVGPRSTGCRNCVSRRVKCDGQRPACKRCERLKLTCPGYRQAIQWVSPQTSIRIKAADQSSDSDSASQSTWSQSSSSSSPCTTASPYPSEQASDPGSATTPGSQSIGTFSLYHLNPTRSVTPITSPSPYTDDVYCSFFLNRYFSLGDHARDFQHNRSWFWTAIRSPTTAPVSNKACRALIVGFFSNVQRSRHLREEAMTLHSEALTAMQDHLHHEVDLDGICAVSLLQLYEACLYTGPRAWQKHSIAMWHMFQMKGPEFFKVRPARAVFLWMRLQIITEACIARRRCFLEAPEWLEVLNYSDEREDMNIELGDITVFLPGMMQDSQALFQTKDPIEAQRIFDYMVRFLRDMTSWWDRWTADPSRMPVRITHDSCGPDEMWPPPPMPGEMASTTLDFRDLDLASGYALYHAYFIAALRWIDRLLGLDIPGFVPDISSFPLDLVPIGPFTYRVAEPIMTNYALAVVEALHFYTRPQYRTIGAVYMLVPAKQAWIVLPQDSPHSIWLEELMEFMAEKSGFHMPRFVLADHEVGPGLTAKEAARRM